jgi:hypothetical protein
MTPTEVSAGAWIAFGELAGPALAVMLVIGLATGCFANDDANS